MTNTLAYFDTVLRFLVHAPRVNVDKKNFFFLLMQLQNKLECLSYLVEYLEIRLESTRLELIMLPSCIFQVINLTSEY